MFQQPVELEQALDALADLDLRVLAGGTDIFPAARPGQGPTALLDVTRIKDLQGISTGSDLIRIGAATTWTQIVNHPLPPAFDALKAAAREVGSLQIQNAGTIAGNLCNASPAADGVPPLLALDAQIEMASAARGTRVIALSDFITGVRQTALATDEMVTAVLVPSPPAAMRSAFEKLGSRRYLVISIVMTAANVVVDQTGRITRAQVAVGSCSAVAQRQRMLEADMIGQRADQITVQAAHLATLSPIDDIRGSGAYRLDAAREQCQRAIQRAVTV